jgi:ligand-binding sensor domain-containing protein
MFLMVFLTAWVGLQAQYPPYFAQNVETGAPSNEMYWVHQDRDGYIWIGCEAGLFQFNGVRFEHFSSPDLTAKSATGIIQSKATGRIYAYNFNRQLFYVEKERLKVITGWSGSVNGLADDGKGNIWITSSEGTFRLDERSQRTTLVESPNHYHSPGKPAYTTHGISDLEGHIYYQNGPKVFIWRNRKEQIIQLDAESQSLTLTLSRFSKNPWLMSVTGEKVFRLQDGTYQVYRNQSLADALKGKKITGVFESQDGKLWIGTYTGLVCHDPYSGTTEWLHPRLSFSHGIQDQEGNYWFTTLHHGLIRIPNLKVKSWQTLDEAGAIEQYTHAVTFNQNVFLGGTNGILTLLDKATNLTTQFKHEPQSDLGTLYFDPIDNCIYFNKLSSIFRYKEGQIRLMNPSTRPVKCMLHIPEGYFFLSSQGIFFTKTIDAPLSAANMIDLDWYRDIVKSPFSSSYYVASNSGLKEIVPSGNTFKIGRKTLSGKQIISLCSDSNNQKIYAFSFDGGVYAMDPSLQVVKIKQLDDDIRVVQIRFHAGKIFMASNKGILVLNPDTKDFVLFDRYSGLPSNNVRSLAFSGDVCWAVGEGLQQIPLTSFDSGKVPSRIVPRKIFVDGKEASVQDLMDLNYDDKLSLTVDGIAYRSNGNFQFAYRILGPNSNWISVPGEVEKIDFASLPTGNITLELKLIDHEGVDSANSIIYQLYVNPPIWQRWWFYLLMTLTTLFLAYTIFRWRLVVIRRKQLQELQRLRLENELRLTQQNALKAQMNPHFLFNVLNSIKGYIYENDKKNAAKYLSEFSNLVRKVLELSSLPTVSLDQEMEALNLYIDLETMLLQSDFEYAEDIDENVDLSGIRVPALLLQPYVENAFKHGLRHKTGPKTLRIGIEFNEMEELLTVNITDNGIGRQSAAAINAENRGEHRSFATSAMEKRIELLNHERKDVVGVEIRDNFENGASAGTTVTIRIHV